MTLVLPSVVSITRGLAVLRDNLRFIAVAAAGLILLIGTGAAIGDDEIAGERQPESWAGTIGVRSLNLRAGPGEGYPIVGTLKRGDAIVAIDESGRWVRLESSGETEVWAYRAFVNLPADFMAPALGDAENAFIDWAAARGDLEEFSIDSSRRLSIVLAAPAVEATAAAIAREIGCAWRERMQLDEKVTVTVWPTGGPLGGWVAQATCP
jgi:hypothetical protein